MWLLLQGSWWACVLLMSGRKSMGLYFALINTLCTTAPGFSKDYMNVPSISDELYSPIMCNGNSMHVVICEYVRRVSKCSVWVSVWLSVVYGLDDGELALCRQPVLFLWPPPQLQHVGNKPLSSNLQTVQQSMGNYLSQSMVASLSITPSLYLFCSLCLYPFLLPPLPSLSLSLSSFLLSHFCCLSVFSTHSFTRPHSSPTTPPPRPYFAFPPALSAPQHVLWNATAQQLQSH